MHYNFIFFQVTGGSSGIGKCIAMEAAKLGANVSIVARNEDRLRSALEEIKGQCSMNDQKFNYLSGTVCVKYLDSIANEITVQIGYLSLFYKLMNNLIPKSEKNIVYVYYINPNQNCQTLIL